MARPPPLLDPRESSASNQFVVSRNDKAREGSTSCRVVCFNEAKITDLRGALPPSEPLGKAAARNKAMGHPARLSVLFVLGEEACCVCDLANVLELPLSTLSQHLRTLRGVGLISSRQEGKLVFYSLTEAGRRALNFLPVGEHSS